MYKYITSPTSISLFFPPFSLFFLSHMCPLPTSDQPNGAEAAPRNNSHGNEVDGGEWRIDIPIEGDAVVDHNRRALADTVRKDEGLKPLTN